jgi:hypothetical protein
MDLAVLRSASMAQGSATFLLKWFRGGSVMRILNSQMVGWLL